MSYFILVCIRWGALVSGIWLILTMFRGNGKSEYGGYLVVCVLLFLLIPQMPLYATKNYKDVEYSKDGKKPYDTHIEKLDGNTYSITTEDPYTGGHYLEATRKGHDFIVNDDDVRDNYVDGVSEVRFKLKNGGSEIKEYDYSRYSKKPTTGETQKWIHQKE